MTRLNGSIIFLNPDQIQSIEETPDCHVTLMNGNRFIVKDQARIITDKIIAFKATILRRASSNCSKKYLKNRQTAHYRIMSEFTPEEF